MLIAPKQVGDVIAVTAELQNPDGRVVASVVTERPEEGGLEAATREASDLLKEMLRLGNDRSQASSVTSARRESTGPQPTPEGAAEFPDPDEAEVTEPSKVTPLTKEEPAIEERPLVEEPAQTVPDSRGDEAPSEGDIKALEDACESEGVEFAMPETHQQAVEWMLGVREGRFETLPPEVEVEDEHDPASNGEEAAHG